MLQSAGFALEIFDSVLRSVMTLSFFVEHINLEAFCRIESSHKSCSACSRMAGHLKSAVQDSQEVFRVQ